MPENTQQTIATIISLLPVATRLLFDVGGKLIEINTGHIDKQGLLEKLLLLGVDPGEQAA